MNKQREAFENWASDNRLFPRAIDTNMRGDYCLIQTQEYWNAWQARQPEIDALQARITQLEQGRAETLAQEPVAWRHDSRKRISNKSKNSKLY